MASDPVHIARRLNYTRHVETDVHGRLRKLMEAKIRVNITYDFDISSILGCELWCPTSLRVTCCQDYTRNAGTAAKGSSRNLKEASGIPNLDNPCAVLRF